MDTEKKDVKKAIRRKPLKKQDVEEVKKKVEEIMDIGKILRERISFPAYREEPKVKGKCWGVYPSLEVKRLIFHEEDDFRLTVSLFSHDAMEILKMQDAAIASAAEGLNKGAWEFYLHAANHKVQRIQGLYRSEINFVFKVVFPKISQQEVS